ncbi:monofunctional biosynthetic peptidoglycan transglycosylase [Octadecabacter sp. 1_MG-2023]|uniref:monofunctional biosynthetic peptidoglycan transglycosylase n=1 Tax=unclassified Octadecabacter TaxID=196158 RepID=UPI001C0A332E|nr:MULTISPECIES: monofunctional biosynthetic peptidoglycan transglycosylase [unclassified Octadecabacter]MBU2992237.1 monofunctional biosynthetic peptidoglycan transglycosylase [Octadecabacter sp. B2R22]MDO6735007.1 monofunctional biosynthetic peptidoglycan transglycosylase [Octadecabacter sp. 1_MG-2023]
MARTPTKTRKTKTTRKAAVRLRDRPRLFVRRILKYLFRGILIMIALAVVVTAALTIVNPPTTPYMLSESRRVGGVNHTWVAMEDIAPVMARSAVAAEDANFCLHWGLDVGAIQAALAEGGSRGGSTISQQVVKNVYLWHGRSWFRKSLEALMTPMVEAIWSKQRILEVYLNVAEFDEGVFGVEAAAVHYFGVTAADLSPVQAARLAAILPSPKTRSASEPSSSVRRRASSIVDGAATIRADGRADCFE